MTTTTRSFTQTLNTSTKTSDLFYSQVAGFGGAFSVVIAGTFSANWRLQRSLDDGQNWTDVAVITSEDVYAAPAQAPALWRVSAAGGGDFTSGSALVSFIRDGVDGATVGARLLNKDGALVSSTRPMPVAGAGYSSTVDLTRTADTNAYAAGDVVGAATGSSAAFTFAGIGPTAGGPVIITTARFTNDISAVPSGMTGHRLRFYSVTPPSALGDNVAWDMPSGDRASNRGYIDLGTLVDLGSTLEVETVQINKHVVVPSGGSLFAYLVTLGGYTPASGAVFRIVLNSIGI